MKKNQIIQSWDKARRSWVAREKLETTMAVRNISKLGGLGMGLKECKDFVDSRWFVAEAQWDRAVDELRNRAVRNMDWKDEVESLLAAMQQFDPATALENLYAITRSLNWSLEDCGAFLKLYWTLAPKVQRMAVTKMVIDVLVKQNESLYHDFL